MFASVLSIVVSLVLFVYWFRYMCVLILSTKTEGDYTWEVASVNGLSFVRIQERLMVSEGKELEDCQRALQHDYQVVSGFLKQAGQLRVGGSSLEGAMLRIDFWLLNKWYDTHKLSEAKSRAVLQEMCRIVAHFADTVGARAPIVLGGDAEG